MTAKILIFLEISKIILKKIAIQLRISAFSGHGDRYIGSLFRVDEPVPDDSSLCHNSQNTAYSDIEIHDSFQYGERKLAEHKTSKVSTDEYGWHCIAP